MNIACLGGDITNGAKYAATYTESHDGAGGRHLDDIGGQVEVNPDKVGVIQIPAKKKRKTTFRLLKKNEKKARV